MCEQTVATGKRRGVKKPSKQDGSVLVGSQGYRIENDAGGNAFLRSARSLTDVPFDIWACSDCRE